MAHHYLSINYLSIIKVMNERGFSSVGRAPALQAGCQRFESVNLHWVNDPDEEIEKRFQQLI